MLVPGAIILAFVAIGQNNYEPNVNYNLLPTHGGRRPGQESEGKRRMAFINRRLKWDLCRGGGQATEPPAIGREKSIGYKMTPLNANYQAVK